MEFLASAASYVVSFLLVLTVLVFVHEFGHYWVARRCGVRIEIFSIGFGPEIRGWTDRAGTRWKFSLVPLGGYVKMLGDADAASVTSNPLVGLSPREVAESFYHKPLAQRAAIVAAGPAANFLFAAIVFAGLFVFVGQPFTPPDVSAVLPGSAAEKAGIQSGDRILRINGESIERFEEIQRIVQIGLEQPLDIVVRRASGEIVLRAVPTVVEEVDRLGDKHRVARLGLRAGGVEFARHDPLTAIWRSVQETYSQTVGTLRAVGQMIVGSRTTEELGGPLRIAQMSGEVVQGGVGSLLVFIAILSINLGLINLFPVPVLDGGHLMFYAIEAVRGRPLGPRAQEYGFRFGLALVLSLAVFATWNDLVHLRVVEFLVGLVT